MTATSRPFGNDGLGFIRVRRRKFTGQRYWRACREREGKPMPTELVSFDLVRSVRIDGKPRHECLLGLGHLWNVDGDGGYHGSLVTFWYRVFYWTAAFGMDADTRRRLADELVFKGARLPTMAQWEKVWARETMPDGSHLSEAEMIEIKSLLTGMGGA